jgi:hypothetical protein
MGVGVTEFHSVSNIFVGYLKYFYFYSEHEER